MEKKILLHHKPGQGQDQGNSRQRRLQRRAELRAKDAEEVSDVKSVAEEATDLNDEQVKEKSGNGSEIVLNPTASEEVVKDEFCPDDEFSVKGDEISDKKERDDKDKLVGKVIISPVSEIKIHKDIIESEVRTRFEAIGVKVLNLKMNSSTVGDFKSCVVDITPVNLQKIWGRRLGVHDCSLISYYP